MVYEDSTKFCGRPNFFGGNLPLTLSIHTHTHTESFSKSMNKINKGQMSLFFKSEIDNEQ